MTNPISPELELLAQIMVNNRVRTEVTRQNHYWFFNVYFSHHVKYETAPFHKEIFWLTQIMGNNLLVITSFRGSGKTTIIGESFPLWAILGIMQKRNVLLLSRTQEMARTRLSNLKIELLSNRLLKKDLGPFKEESEENRDGKEWQARSIVLPKYNARISAISSEQNIRGTKFGAVRPDLIIVDDIEDIESVRTKESRKKTYEWLKGDIFPLGDKDTSIVVIGNLLHEDSLTMRLKESIESDKMDGTYRSYPLVSDEGVIMWPGKYPTMEDIEKLKRSIDDPVIFEREFNVKILTEERIIHQEWIKYYDRLPSKDCLVQIAIGIDPASTLKETSDFTAMIATRAYVLDNDLYIYVLPDLIHKQMEHPETIETAKCFAKSVGRDMPAAVFVEGEAYQRAIAQDLVKNGINAEAVPLGGLSKDNRLRMASSRIKSGHIVFPKEGAEKLIEEMINFGSMKHDDAVDAFTLVVNKLDTMDFCLGIPEVGWISYEQRN